MNTRKKWTIRKTVKKTFWLLATIALMLMCVEQALASTAANTAITNTVNVTYNDAAGANSYSQSATTTITVLLMAAAPTIDSPPAINPATETTANTLTYTIRSNANGLDTYDITTTIVNVDVSGETVLINGGTASIDLGGTTLAADAPLTATAITVPYDSNADGNSAATNGIIAGRTIIIGGNPYEVASILEDPASSTTTINIVGAIAGTAGSAGDVVGEQVQFPIVVTTGTLGAGLATGTHTVTATATSTADNSMSTAQTTATVITVERPLLSVNKYARNTDGSTGTGTAVQVDGIDYYPGGVTGQPGDTLEYLIVVTNPAGAGNAIDVRIEDAIPQFTTYVPNSMSLDGAGVNDASDGDAGEYDGATGTVWIYAGSTPGNDGSVANNYTDGTGGTLSAGATTRGIFSVTID